MPTQTPERKPLSLQQKALRKMGLLRPVDLALHRHEMLFGYAGAVIAGFLLTAIPNWTQRPLLRGRPLMLLFGAWCVGRGGMLQVPGSTIVAALGDAAFFWGLVIYAWREIRLAGNRRGIPVCLLATALATLSPASAFSSVSDGRGASRNQNKNAPANREGVFLLKPGWIRRF